MLLECIKYFCMEYEVNKLKNEDGYSCFYAFVKSVYFVSIFIYMCAHKL